VVRAGAEAIGRAFSRLSQEGVAIALVDAICEEDLAAIAEAARDLPLITGGSGIAAWLPRLWPGFPKPSTPAPLPSQTRPPGALILAGSCSAATLRQLEVLEESGVVPVHRVEPAHPGGGGDRLTALARDALHRGGAVAVRCSAAAAERDADPATPARLEEFFATLARRLVGEGLVGRLVVAGGETSGAVVDALGIQAVEIVSILDPGVPSLRTVAGAPLALALKSGNFGSEDFFLKTLRALERT
jgi:uncharacterized protein YgbK (DUF1537 family)